MHAGVAPDAATGGILTPIHQSTTFVQESIDAYMAKGYSYSRTTNPTVAVLEAKVAELEGAAGSCCDTKPDAVGSKRTRYELDCTNAGTS